MGHREVVSASATIAPAIQVVPLDGIDFVNATFRVRVHVDHAELRPSLREHGQLAPVTLRATARTRSPFQIVCGFRRPLAMRELCLSSAQARILDRGHAIGLLRERHGHTLASAAAMNLSTRHTRRPEKLTGFPAALRAAIAAGRFKVAHAMVIMAHFLQGGVSPESAIDGLLARLPATVASAAWLRDRLKAGDGQDDSPLGEPGAANANTSPPRLYATRALGVRLKPVNIVPETLDKAAKARYRRDLEALLTWLTTGSLGQAGGAVTKDSPDTDAVSGDHRVTPQDRAAHRARTEA